MAESLVNQLLLNQPNGEGGIAVEKNQPRKRADMGQTRPHGGFWR